MSTQEIIDILCDTLNDGVWALRVLYAEGAMHKEGLWKCINKYHKEFQLDNDGVYEGEKLPSRYSLDIMTARLEGAGLITFKQLGRVRIYEVSKLGLVIITELEKRAKNTN
ncbi:cell division protein FtsZ [Bacillus sp. AFS098217]|uniref:cell division protein FtsZ n=1 Tax=Bacillus sp. AFS098217 TaxID=2033868 RepID=UPI0015CF6F8E|nr:cell division protein FtsZ [Bacillus sp. AFS098217]